MFQFGFTFDDKMPLVEATQTKTREGSQAAHRLQSGSVHEAFPQFQVGQCLFVQSHCHCGKLRRTAYNFCNRSLVPGMSSLAERARKKCIKLSDS